MKRQPIVNIGANNLFKLAMAASFDVSNGDEDEPFVKEIRKQVENALRIVRKAADKKDFKLTLE